MFFGLFDSQEKKMRSHAANWLELAEKIYNYRRDVLSAPLLGELQSQTANLRTTLKKRDNAAELKLAIESLEGVLRRAGGTHYPKSGWTENIEFFLVAAIVILGVRMYFVQPFKIPTNSMWPSYNGMTPEVFATKADEPNAAQRAARLVLMGARSRTMDAPTEGEILIPLSNGTTRGIIRYTEVPARDWFVFPSKNREYSFVVGDKLTTTRVPLDFDFDWVIRDAFFPGTKPLYESIQEKYSNHEFIDREIATPTGIERMRLIRTGKFVKAGDRVLSFDILTGDQLFVDRVSYHFVRPQVGDGFVFRTDNIHSSLMTTNGLPGGPQLEQYYIKRLAGVPGDTLEIREPVLYRNGAPITGSKAYNLNATRAQKYPGYRNGPPSGILRAGETFTVPPDSYVALGDNSANSQDSRYWGTVPAQDVVGRPLFIYFPFTKRWGPAP